MKIRRIVATLAIVFSLGNTSAYAVENTATVAGDQNAVVLPQAAVTVVDNGKPVTDEKDLKTQWEKLKADVEKTESEIAARKNVAGKKNEKEDAVNAGTEIDPAQTAWAEEYVEDEVKSAAESPITRQWAEMDKPLELRHIDKKALEIVKAFEQAKSAPAPVAGMAGRIVFTYGSMAPRIVCRPMRVTDLQLEPGEKVMAPPSTGDPVRWAITPSISAENGLVTIHVMIKPAMPNISTNLTIHTDRRTYLVELTSEEERYMPFVSFFYPENVMNDWESFVKDVNKQVERKGEESDLPEIDPSELDFQYEIEGKNVPWKPLRAYNDGTKTYIQMSKKMGSHEAPAFVQLEGRTRKLVNYRVKGDLYVIDRLFKKGMLIIGKDKVVIRYTGVFANE